MQIKQLSEHHRASHPPKVIPGIAFGCVYPGCQRAFIHSFERDLHMSIDHTKINSVSNKTQSPWSITSY